MGEVKVELELENAVDRELLRLGHIAKEQLRSAKIQALVRPVPVPPVPSREEPFPWPNGAQIPAPSPGLSRPLPARAPPAPRSGTDAR